MKSLATLFRWCWLWIGLLASWPVVAQNQPTDCGTDPFTAQRLATDTTYRRFYQNLKPNQNKGGVDTTTVYTIPVVFVVYHLGEAVGTGSNVSEAALQAQIDLMNRMFAGQRPDYAGVDTKIRFALAQRTPSCTPFNGIARVDARSVPGYEATGLGLYDSQMSDRLRRLLPDYAGYTNDRFVIVRVAHRVYGASGWASYGSNIFVSAGTMQNTSANNTLLTHEMGHSLFLVHTFAGGDLINGQYICPSNTNPDYQGDLVADTDPHKPSEPNNACDPASENAINSCTGQPFGLIGRNHMSYGCNTILFTRGQMIRMRSYFTENSRGLLNSPYLNPPQANEAVVAACIPTVVNATGGGDEGLHQFYFQQINRQNEFGQPYVTGHYFDHSCTERATVTAGQSYSLSLIGTGRFRRVYIDYNNDGAFDEGTERVLSHETNSNWGQASSGQIVIPANAVIGPYLRVRVIVNGGSVAPTACNLPIGQYNASGEAHDYGVRVLPTNTPASLSIGTLASAYVCRNQQLNVPISTEGTFDAGNVFTVQLSDATGSFQNPIVIGSSSASPVPVQLPLFVPLGSDYRMRVVASSPALTSFPGPTLTLNDLPTATISGSQSLLAGQTATLTITLTGRPLWQTRLNRNGQTLVRYFDTNNSPISYTFVAQDSDVYTLGYVQNGCGYGTVSGAATISVPCSTPISLTETQTGLSTVQVGWSTSPNVVYDIEWKEVSATTWNHYEYVYGSQHTLNGLEVGKTYQWRVRKWCLDGVSDWTSPRTFTIQCVIPSQPTEQFTGTSATLSWQPVPNTLSYIVRSREAGSSNWQQVHTLSVNQYALTNLVAGTVYEWQVLTYCTNEVQSDYTPIRWFTTQCAVPQPGNAVNETPASVRVNWTGGQTGLRYQLRWRPVGASAWTVLDTLTTNTNQIFSGLPAYTSYEWQVRSFCSGSQFSEYSATGTFNTICQPPSSGYATNTSATSVQLSWYTSGGTTIDLRWRALGSITWNAVNGASSGGSGGGTSGTYNLTGLTTGTTYEWQLQARCPGGSTSGFGQSFTFTAQCPPPQGLYESEITASTARLNWFVNHVSIPPTTVNWRVLGSTTWQTSVTLAPTTTNSYAYTLTNLTPGTTYEWQVIYYCPGGNLTTSASRTFVAQCPVPIPGYTYNDADAVMVSYSYRTNSGYQVHWRPVGSTTWTESTTTTSTSYRITGLAIGTPYEWQVRAICTDGSISDYSSSLTIVAVCPVPSTSVQNIRPTSARLIWTNNISAAEIRWRPTNSATWTTIPVSGTNVFVLTGLTNGVFYEWQVRSVCLGATLSDYSSSSFFLTACRLPYSLYETYVLASSAAVNWSGAESDMQHVVEWRPQGTTTWQQSGTPTSGSSYTITGLTNGLTYEWRVSTDCDGVLTPSASRTFTAQCAQLQTNQTNYYNVTSGGANLSWYVSSGLSGLPGLAYRVRLRPVGTTTWTESATLTATFYSVTGLTNNTAYEWQVQSICDGVGSPYVTGASPFTTNCAASVAYAPPPGDVWVQLNWTTIPGERYNLEYRIATDPAWTSINSLTASTYQLTTTPGTAYEYRIRTACSDGNTGVVSNVVAFTTLPACDPNEPNDSFTAATPISGTSFTSVALCIGRPGDQDWFRWQHNGYDYYVVLPQTHYTGPYQLSLDLVDNTLTVKMYSVNGSYPPVQLQLMAADGITQIMSGTYSSSSIVRQIVYTLPPVCTVMTTVKAGNWTDPTVWSCGRQPISTDTVLIQHTVTVPNGTTGQAKRMTYGAGGKLNLLSLSRIKLGN